VKTLEVVQNEVASHKTIVMDDKHFVGCKYTECKLIYGGGETQSTDSVFEKCPIVFSGAAQRTIGVLVSLGALPPGGMAVPAGGNQPLPKKPDGKVQ
jgi:hypothetical protein